MVLTEATSRPPILLGTARFTPERVLGAGGMGVVYQAYDHERSESVALKTIETDAWEGLRSLKEEFRTLADIAHPNLVTLFDLHSDGDRLFFTMELVDGQDFISYVRPGLSGQGSHHRTVTASGSACLPTTSEEPTPVAVPPLDLGRLRSALHQLAEGLIALHAAGKLHRDIKPSNVLVSQTGRVVIVDFGLAVTLSEATGRELSSGTPAYMAPERFTGRPLMPASDWFSVGAMLYEALTAQRPFPRNCFLEPRWEKPPPPPGDMVAGVPPQLASLCMDLLTLDPRHRADGQEILRRLGEERSARITPADKPLVGRERELLVLNEAFDRVRRGSGVSVFIRGPSGVGKSCLLRHFLNGLRGKAVVLEGRCYERESVPFKALDSLLEALAQHLAALPHETLRELLPRHMGALARMFPALRCVAAYAPPGREISAVLDPPELRRLAFAAFKELLGRLADRVRLVLSIDDLQWGDPDSAALLRELLRPPDPAPLLFLCSHRWEGPGSGVMPGLPELKDDLVQISLEPLRPTEAEALALAALELSGAALAAYAPAIARESHGSPFFIQELVNFVLHRSTQGVHADVPREITLDGVLQERWVDLGPDARRLLETVAAAGRPVQEAVVRRAVDLGADWQPTVAALRAARLLRWGATPAGDELELFHDRMRESFARRMTPEARRLRHLALAVALEQMGRADPEQLADHFALAGDQDRGRHYAIEAAGRAADSLAFDRAAELYRRALALSAAGAARRFELGRRLGEALANAGRCADAASAFGEAAGLPDTEEGDRLELLRRAAEQLLIGGHVDEGLALIDRVLRGARLRLAGTPRRALLSLLLGRLWILIRGLHFRETDAPAIPKQTLRRVDTCWSVAVGLAMVDFIRAGDFQARHLLLALGSGEPFRIARALACEAGFLATGRGPSRRRSAAVSAIANSIARRLGSSHALGLCSLTDGMAAFYQGRWEEALELEERAEQILLHECTGVPWELNTARLYQLRSLYYRGSIAELSKRVRSFLRLAQEQGNLYAATIFRTGVANAVWLADDRSDVARRMLDDALSEWSRKGFHVEHYFALHARGELLLYEQRSTEAWEELSRQWSGLKGSMLLRVHHVRIVMLQLRARIALAAAAVSSGAERRRLLRGIERDAGRIEGAGMRWPTALATLLEAGVASLRDDRAAAERKLELAIAELETAGLGSYAAAARARLGKLRGGEGGGALTSSAEAWMAGQGIRNPARFTALLAPGLSPDLSRTWGIRRDAGGSP